MAGRKQYIIKNVEFNWARLDPDSPGQYQGQGRFKWSILISTKDQKQKNAIQKQLGDKNFFKIKEGDDGNMHFVRNLYRNAYYYDPNTQGDNLNVKAKHPTVISSQGGKIDGSTIGNGSIGDIVITQRESAQTSSGYAYEFNKLKLSKYVEYMPEPELDFDDVDEDSEFEVVTAEDSEDLPI